ATATEATRRSALGEKPSNVAHLAAGPCLCLAVKMDCSAILLGEVTPFLDLGADQIGHDRITVARCLAKRPTANRSRMIFELAHDTGVERPVTRVVHARRNLVDHEIGLVTATLEHLNGKHADMAECPGDLAGDGPRREGRALRDARRDTADGEDPVLVHVFHRIIEFDGAILATHRDDRNFAPEPYQSFEHGGDTADRSPSALNLALVADQHLSLAVIAEPPRLEQRRKL